MDIERGRVKGLVPDLVYAEVAHVLARYAKAGRLTRDQIARALHEVHPAVADGEATFRARRARSPALARP